MTKAELFRKAHQLAKTFTGDYRARFSLALVELTGIVKAGHIYTEGVKEMSNEITMSEEAKEINARFLPSSYGSMNKTLLKALQDEMIEEDNDLTLAIMNFNSSTVGKKFTTSFNYESKLYVAGNTYKVKEELKEMGFVFKGHYWVK